MQLKKISFSTCEFIRRTCGLRINSQILIIFIFITLLFSIGCKKKAAVQEPVVSQTEAQTLPADFIAFYEKFHADSAYQMAHIQFPLEGFPAQADSNIVMEKSFRWTADTWRMHRHISLLDTLFIRKFESPLPMMVTEKIQQRNTPFSMYRRFYKRGDEWMLIFYSDMNAMNE